MVRRRPFYSRFTIYFLERSRDRVDFEDEGDLGDFAPFSLAEKVEEDGGGGGVSVPDVARAHALAESEAGGLGGRGGVEDLHVVFGGEVFRVHDVACAPSAAGRGRRGRTRGCAARRASGGFQG